MKIAQRAQRIEPFYVMEMAKQAQALAQAAANSAQPMIFLNIGEPDFTAPPAVQAAAEQAIRDGRTQYTPALGIAPLRERISAWYGERFGVQVPARRIVVTAGASAALHLAVLSCFDPGDEVLMPDPCYPCNRHLLTMAQARAKLLPTDAGQRFQLTADQVAAAWDASTAGVLLASPSNPTGTSIDPGELAAIHGQVQQRGGVTLVDEIYLGLSYDRRYGQTALALDDQLISVNSFSKYFNMTGWRLGWLVVPDALIEVVERLAQNLYICASTVAQHAALACFEPDTLALLEQRRAEFRQRLAAFIPGLRELGFGVPVQPDGAFYAWADASPLFERLGVHNSSEFALQLMHRAHIAVTPSRDFSEHDAGTHIRFSTATDWARLEQALQRMRQLLG